MEKSACRLHGYILAVVALYSFLVASPCAYGVSYPASDSTIPGTLVLADIGGPYSGVVGEEVSFDGSQSRDAKNIEFYVWDFGDGETGTGQLTTHRYMNAGFYNASLTVIGFHGGRDTDHTGVYIRNLDLSIEAVISPVKAKYEYGDRITSVDVFVRFPNKTGVDSASVSGSLTGKEHIDLKFINKGNGRYFADVLYPVLKGEGSFIVLSVKAVDPYGNSGSYETKILVSPSDQDVQLDVYEPEEHNRIFAYGQKIPFKARLVNVLGRPFENESVLLYEGWSGRNYSFIRNGDSYYYNYEVPRDAQSEIAFLVNGKGVLDGKPYNTAKILDFGISNKLNVVFVEPALGEYSSNISRIVLNVT